MLLIHGCVGFYLWFSKIILASHDEDGIVRLTRNWVAMRCACSAYVLDSIEPLGIVKVASIAMPHSVGWSGRLGMMTYEPTFLVLGLSAPAVCASRGDSLYVRNNRSR